MKNNIKTRNLAIMLFFMTCGVMQGQEPQKLYDPSVDGMKQIKEAVALVRNSGKHLLIQYGGNWCPWCIKFASFCKTDTAINKLISDNYIWIKLNYSPENRNLEANEFLGNPKRFGFPVLIIVDGKGKVLHIQDSEFLEEGQGYDQKKTVRFLQTWTAAAIIPNNPAKEVRK
ncbi:MAG: thioredoxin family protein [Bacteroidales bacterium]|jgi:thioredoxin-related protein